VLDFSAIVTTKMACGEPRMSAERGRLFQHRNRLAAFPPSLTVRPE
jgi:hypothetical protein